MSISPRQIPFRQAILVLSSSILLILAFPKFSWSYLAWVAFIPFMMALESKTAWARFRLGYLTGIFSSLGIFYWVTHSMRYYGGLNFITSLSILFLLVLYLALYYGVFAWLWGLFPSRGFGALFWAPAIWVGLEFIRSHFLTGFPWALLGYSQYNFIFIIQISEITGIYGISFLVILVNQMLYQLAFAADPFWGWSGKWKETGFTILLFLIILGFGYYSCGIQDQKDRKAPVLGTAVVQGNIDQSLKWNPAYQAQTVWIYRELSEATFPKKPDLIIWPETAVPFYFLNDNRLTSLLFQLAREGHTYLLFGSPATGFKDGVPEYFNRAYLLGPDGQIHFYDKVHLVPFGEYVPLKRFLPFVGKMVQAIGDFTPGSGSFGLPHPKTKIGVLICFETIFPELSRKYKQDGCRILVNITNDAWFGRTSGPYQHLSMLVFRAVENRLWIARSANTGFSAVIDSSGRIVKQIPLFQRGEIYANIPLRDEKTFYSQYGDWVAGLSGVIFFAGLIMIGINHKRRGKV